jgi:hypothetical protein
VILSGVAPRAETPTVEIEYSWRGALPRAYVVITTEPTAPVLVVAEAYRHVLRKFFERPLKRLSPKGVEVFRFVLSSERCGAVRPSWQTLMKDWNSTHPDRVYGDRRRFRRDYSRAEQAVLTSWIDEDAGDYFERELNRRTHAIEARRIRATQPAGK